jgi:ATP-binding cassette subfamily B protein
MPKRNKNIDRLILRLFVQTTLRFKKYLPLAVFYALSGVLLSTVIPLLVGKMIASLVVPNSDPFSYLPWLVAAAFVGFLGNRYGFRGLMHMQAKGARYLQERSLDALLKRSVGFHNNNIGGKLVSDTIDLPNSYLQLGGAFFVNLIPFSIVLIVGTTLVFVHSALLGLIVLVMCLLTLFSGLIDRKFRINMRLRQIDATKAATAHIADTIVNVQTVKAFAREDRELNEVRKLGDEVVDARLSNWITAGNYGSFRLAGLIAMQIGLVVAIVKLVQQSPEVLGVGIFAFSFTIMLATRLFEVNFLLRSIDEALMHAAPMTEILHEQPEILDAPDAKPLHIKKGVVDLDGVSFQYPDSKTNNVFSKLDLHIKSGEKIGLVGPSGGGKSTLTRLLLRFEDTTAGAISIDDQHIAEVTQASLREAIAYVPQEPLLFHRSIRENIAYSKIDATDADIRWAARLAHADDFIKTLPDAYETIVGERGVKLSGGQRQRIAIARAILKDAPILVLDEATSALDSESEVLIQDALRELMKGRTTIVIAHRLSTIQKMDRILVLEDGNITEEGSHKVLLGKKGTYAKLWKHQSGGFLEE